MLGPVIIKFLFSATVILTAIYFYYCKEIKSHIFTRDLAIKNKLDSYISDKKSTKKYRLFNPECNFFTCFNVNKCGNQGKRLSVYVYPLKSFKDLRNGYFSREFYIILKTIMTSKYYTSNPHEACVLVPSMEMISPEQRSKFMVQNLDLLWLSRSGENHLIFNFELDDIKKYDHIYDEDLTSRAMFAGVGLTKPIYRKNFDISFPMMSLLLKSIKFHSYSRREWVALSAQLNIDSNIKRQLINIKELFPDQLLILSSCKECNTTDLYFRCMNNNTYEYPSILQHSKFCLVLKGNILGLSILLEALATRCIPVVVFDNLILPFDEKIDWTRAAVFIKEDKFLSLINILNNNSPQKIKEYQEHGTWLYKRYFSSTKIITETVLEIMSDRIFPYSSKSYNYWNEQNFKEIVSPVLIPLTISRTEGFTAVILTYDRLDLLFLLINKLSRVKSLTKIVVIWNNKYKSPPRISRWPKTHKTVKVILTDENLLSNRFYPFDDIETEAIFAIDDDIIMLTEDEIEFAFEVWREFPDRIVGFPSRTHAWDNKTLCWKYESEWTNHISLVLTGAAFYHKYWNYVFTTKLPKHIRKWVDEHMNCEDIAMNFLISNTTRKAPIKVTAKKKFRCPECVNTEMLSADLTHMIERTQCINYFTEIFDEMPLKSVEFRADPVLFKDYFPDKLKRFNNVGML